MNSRSKRVVEGIRRQVKDKLLADFHEALQKSEAEARSKGAPFGEGHRLEIMMGFAQGCIAAGAEVAAQSGIPYLHYLSVCACIGSKARSVMGEGEESLHQLFHKLMSTFPGGDLPASVVFDSADSPVELLEMLRAVGVPDPPIAPEDLN